MQRAGLELLIAADMRKEGKDWTDQLRFALVSANPSEFLPKLFPELERARRQAAVDKSHTEIVQVADDETLEDTTGSWDFSQSTTTEAEMDDLIARAAQLTTFGKLTPKDVDPEGWR